MNLPLLGLDAALEKVKPRVMNEFVEEFSYGIESEANSPRKGVVTSHLHCVASPMPNSGLYMRWPLASPTNYIIRGPFEACTFDHVARMDAFQIQIRECMQSDARWKQIQQESNHSSSVYYSLLLGVKHLDVLEMIIDIAGRKARRNLFPAQYTEVSTFLDIFIGISSPRPLFHPKAASSALEDFGIAKYYRALFAKPTPVSSKGEEDVSKMLYALRSGYSKSTYVFFLARSGYYVKGVVGLVKDLCKVGSIYPLIVVGLPDVPADHRRILSEKGCIVREIEPIYPLENQVQFAMAYYVINYSKVQLWEFDEYSKMICLDADIQLNDNIDHLFDLPDIHFYAVTEAFVMKWT
ncbi:hypothetical protein SUGI_0488380 [Cryptomeria japonica]|nr:hypothetical protein SUGI_0488380 [Cryptomeria japonica]